MLRDIAGVVLGFIVGLVAAVMFMALLTWLFADHVGVGMTKQEGFKGAFFVWLLGARALVPSIGQAIHVVVGGLVASKVSKAAPGVVISIVGALTAMAWFSFYISIHAYSDYHGSPWRMLELLFYPPVIWRTIRHANRVRGAQAAATLPAGSP